MWLESSKKLYYYEDLVGAPLKTLHIKKGKKGITTTVSKSIKSVVQREFIRPHLRNINDLTTNPIIKRVFINVTKIGGTKMEHGITANSH